MRCPGELYQNSSRKYSGGIEELVYQGVTPRRVNQNGCIRCKDQTLFISQSLSGWSVGLKSIKNQKIELWFAQWLLAISIWLPAALSALTSILWMLKPI
jgi:hypothetical protein